MTSDRRPSRRTFLATATGAVVAGRRVCAQERPPNVLMIISDDHGWTDYGFMGHRQVETPHLDRLAAQSVVYRRGYVPASLCCPSLGAIITGQYPHQTGICCNDPPLPVGVERAAAANHPDFVRGAETMAGRLHGVPTIPRLLAERGYLSFQTGKWWQGDFATGGFTHGMSRKTRSAGGRHGDDGLTIGRQGLQPIYDFVTSAGDRPWLVWYAPMLPHQPHNPPPALLEKYRAKTESLPLARYWAMVDWFDQTCGALLDWLDNQRLADRTLVTYLADNGWIQQPGANGARPDSKLSQYDGGLRTPLLVRYPNRAAPRVEDVPVTSLDLAPTILRACGAGPTPAMAGVDLLDSASVRARQAVYGACFTHNAVDLARPASSLMHRWMVADPWKLIVPDPANAIREKKPGRGLGPELYRIVEDPFEERNMAAELPTRVAELTRQLEAWWPGR